MRIAIVAGVRPHFVKLSSLLPHLRPNNEVYIIHTGQHYDYSLSDVFFNELRLPQPDFSIGVGAGTHSEQTGTAIIELERILADIAPNLVLVIGDANSSLSGALAAAKQGIEIGHIEAGARNFDLSMPEEVNRLMIDSVSTYYFCPTQGSVQSLQERGVKNHLFFCGDLLLDVVLAMKSNLFTQSHLTERFKLINAPYCLVTIHREANTDDEHTLTMLTKSILKLDVQVVFPLHPRTRNALQRYGLFSTLKQAHSVKLLEPVNHKEILSLIKHSKFVLTDSNGIQREAYFLETPCLITRKSTEYNETLSQDCSILVGTNRKKIIEGVNKVMTKKGTCFYTGEFGTGQAGQKIAQYINEVVANE